MESLEDFNNRMRKERWMSGYVSGADVPDGISCPSCGGPLHDSKPGEMLYSDPGQMHVACEACGHTGLRVA